MTAATKPSVSKAANVSTTVASVLVLLFGGGGVSVWGILSKVGENGTKIVQVDEKLVKVDLAVEKNSEAINALRLAMGKLPPDKWQEKVERNITRIHELQVDHAELRAEISRLREIVKVK